LPALGVRYRSALAFHSLAPCLDKTWKFHVPTLAALVPVGFWGCLTVGPAKGPQAPVHEREVWHGR
jgi:hypothetical protein